MTKYKPRKFKSPFGHVTYTLVRNQEQYDSIIGHGNRVFMNGEHDCIGMVSYFNDNLAVVQVGDMPPAQRDKAILTLVHEAVHVYQFIKERMGEASPGDEFEAYSIEQVVANLYAAYIESEPGDS